MSDNRSEKLRPRARPRAQPDVNLNLNVRGLRPSATLEINELSAELAQSGRKVYRLGLGQSPFPVPESVVEELRANAHQKAYLEVRGLGLLRDAVAAYFLRRQGIEYSREEVLVGPGSKELMFILQLVYYGDLVIPTPSWVSYAPQAHIIGRQIRWLNTLSADDWRLTPDEIESLCESDPRRPRLLVINYPNNPSGFSYTPSQLQNLARAARKYRMILLSDEIYGELDHSGRHVSIARYYPEGTIVSTGLSKWCGAGGWRLGTFLFPKSLHWLLEAMSVVASETYTATSAPIQFAGVRAFEGGLDIEDYLAQSRRILGALGRLLSTKLRAVGVRVNEPQGGFYLFPDLDPFRESLDARGIRTSAQLCKGLLDHLGVAVLPGAAFGRRPEELTARISYVDFDGARALTEAQHVPFHESLDEKFLRYFCQGPVEAVELMCDWLRNGS